MSLQLDPFLWSSYEALCELGGADDLDPTSIFGVQPAILEIDPSAQTNKPLQDRSVLTPSFSMAETPASAGGGKSSVVAGFYLFFLSRLLLAVLPPLSPKCVLHNL